MASMYIRAMACLALALNIAAVQGIFWTVTENLAIVETVSITTYYYTYSTRTSTDPYTYTGTRTRTVKSGITPSGTPYSTSTYDRTYYDMRIISVFYPAGAVKQEDLEPTSIPTSSSSINYFMDVVWTAPATCASAFTWSTRSSIIIPSAVESAHLVSATSVKTATTTNFYGGRDETWYLAAGAAPTPPCSSDYYCSAYIASCTTPYGYSRYPSATSTLRSGGGDGGGYSYDVCTLYSGCTSLKTWVIIVASIIPSLFLIGFIESYIWFRRLMLGKGCLRFGTISWIMLSLWVACFTRTQSGRSAEDQKMLREQWKNIGGWTRFKLWWKWGFRHSYPVPLLGDYSRNTVGYLPPGAPGTNGGMPPPGGPMPPNGGMPPMGGMPQYAPQQPYMQQQQPYFNGAPQPYPGPGMQQPYQQQPVYNLAPGQQPYPSPSPVSQQSTLNGPMPVYMQPGTEGMAKAPAVAESETSVPTQVSEVANTPRAVSEVPTAPREGVSEVGSVSPVQTPAQPHVPQPGPPGAHS